jgi:hypothetical protein
MEYCNCTLISFCGILIAMSVENIATKAKFESLYRNFHSPLSAFDCGTKCAPYNENGVPFCCDIKHAVPTAYQPEWEYLQENTDLWQPWNPNNEKEKLELLSQTPTGQVLIACQGHEKCQRNFRALTCRSFPFFPYFTGEGKFIGMSYYWDYEDRCWVISNLQIVSPEYRTEFMAAYKTLFQLRPEEKENFMNHSAVMRKTFRRKHKTIPLLHKNGGAYKITPHNERMRRTPPENLPKFGPYAIAARLPFPGDDNP